MLETVRTDENPTAVTVHEEEGCRFRHREIRSLLKIG